MKSLLDTHSFLWFIGGDARLSAPARQTIENVSNDLFLSAASLWEVSIKVSLGKLNLGAPFGELVPEELARQRIAVLPIEMAHLNAVATLPFHHRDPFDRLIVAQALTEKMPVIGVDESFDAYGVQRIW